MIVLSGHTNCSIKWINECISTKQELFSHSNWYDNSEGIHAFDLSVHDSTYWMFSNVHWY